MPRGRDRRRLGHGRPQSQRDKTPRFLVVVGGEVTEADYFHLRNKLLGNRAKLTVRHKRADPLGLVEYAVRLKASEAKSGDGDGFDGVYAVTDVDDFPLGKFVDAERLCRSNGITLVVTNPCFEAWLIDHVEVCRARTTREAQARAKNLGVVSGDSGKDLVASQLEGHLVDAMRNASTHNTVERSAARSQLHTLDFAPWTDMPEVEYVFEGRGRQSHS